jgi:hypothetical protein
MLAGPMLSVQHRVACCCCYSQVCAIQREWVDGVISAAEQASEVSQGPSVSCRCCFRCCWCRVPVDYGCC